MKGFSIRMILIIFVIAAGLYSFSFAQVELQLLLHMNLYGSAGYNDCWGYTAPDGREYALLGVDTGTSIVDITDPANAYEVDFIPSVTSTWKDIKTYQHYAYAVNESGGGLQIMDLSNLPNSVTELPAYTGFSTSHNIYIDVDNAMLYAEGEGSAVVRAISLADPENPVQLSTFGLECHDIYARDNIAYISEGFSGSIGIYDLSTPTSPTFLARINVPNSGYVHNAWLSDDGNFLMSTEETSGKTVKYWDISNINQPSITDEYLGGSSLAHNAHIKGDYAYISHYESGLKVVDISDPYNIFEVGYYDTYPQGESPNFHGAWGAFPFFHSGKILISDIQTGLYVVYFQGAADGDSLDPNPPENLAAYSDYNTPNSMLLTWDDPTTYFSGDPLSPSDFTIEIKRDDSPVASVPGGSETYTDNGLNDGQQYEYKIYAKIIATDSTSMEVSANWHAGGSPIPAAPTNIDATFSASEVVLTWNDPTTQEDGTPLDDLDKILIYRDGAAIDSVAAGAETYTDVPSPGFFYHYTLRAKDNEIPPNLSAVSNEAGVFAGTAPDYLVWVGPDIPSGTGSAISGDSIFAALVANGESAFLTNNLFEFSTDLSIHKGVFVVLGIFSNNHVLPANSAEALALETYLAGGGNLYLEGGDCFYYDPLFVGGHDINPWFDCNPLGDGSSDVFNLVGLNDLSAFQFAYNGENNWMDELSANGSMEVWQESTSLDIQGLFYTGYAGGNGRSIGMVPSFGGMMSSTAPLNPKARIAQKIPEAAKLIHDIPKPKARIHHENSKDFVKKAAYYPELKKQRKSNEELLKITSNGVQIFANNQVDLMAAYLAFFDAGVGAPAIAVSPDSINFHSVYLGSDSTISLMVQNQGTDTLEVDNILITNAAFTVDTSNFNVLPSAMYEVQVTFAPSAPGSYNGLLRIISNDPANDTVDVAVSGFGELPVGIPSPTALPETFALNPNYPNPFNPTTMIAYQVPRQADVRIEIYNTLGQKVRTLLNNRKEPGYYQAVWNGRNDSGMQVGSGVYLYRMAAGDFVQTRKMILMK